MLYDIEDREPRPLTYLYMTLATVIAEDWYSCDAYQQGYPEVLAVYRLLIKFEAELNRRLNNNPNII